MSEQPVHLLVLIHGMWGNPKHLDSMHRILRECRIDTPSNTTESDGVKFEVLIPETNQDDSTYDGIDWGGERVAEEIFQRVKQLEDDGKTVTRFSITGYSLGGLIARYVIGILYERHFFDKVTPVNFNTIATPHIGLLKYRSTLSKLFYFLGPKLLSRTGEQFYVIDKWSPRGRPLLEVMADPDRIFFQGLSLFPHVRIYANAVNDVTVPYPTAAIEHDDIFIDHLTKAVELERDSEYPAVIQSYKFTDQPPPEEPAPFYKRFFNLRRPLVPPPLQFSFPYNILVYILLPVVMPLFISLVITRLSLASHKSRGRIQLLEKDEKTYSQTLVHTLGQIERQVEDAVADMIDDSGNVSQSPVSTLAPTPVPGEAEAHKGKSVSAPAKQQHAILTPLQHKLVDWLNGLPQLKKELVWIDPVRNSHAVIIARDIKRFPSQKVGEEVLRHWADHLVL